MGSIKIISVPPGQAPEWVRKEWIGVVITLQAGLIGNKYGSYRVDAHEAIRRLKEKSPEAATWLEKNLRLTKTTLLMFAKTACCLER